MLPVAVVRDSDGFIRLQFFADPANTDEAIRLGLAIPNAVAETKVSAAEPTSKSE